MASIEDWVLANTCDYGAPFKDCLSFDGQLEHVSPYDATLRLAYDTTFDPSGPGRTAKWMDDNYNPSSLVFRDRVCQSLNLAVNLVADLIYSVAVDANIPEFPQAGPLVLLAVLILAGICFKRVP